MSVHGHPELGVTSLRAVHSNSGLRPETRRVGADVELTQDAEIC